MSEINPNLDPKGSAMTQTEREIESALRPGDFHEFMGQKQVVDNLIVFVRAAKQRGEALDHTLLH